MFFWFHFIAFYIISLCWLREGASGKGLKKILQPKPFHVFKINSRLCFLSFSQTLLHAHDLANNTPYRPLRFVFVMITSVLCFTIPSMEGAFLSMKIKHRVEYIHYRRVNGSLSNFPLHYLCREPCFIKPHGSSNRNTCSAGKRC